MKIIDTYSLKIKDIKIIKFQRFCDERGYFTETYNLSDFNKIDFLDASINFLQFNESFSKKGTIRGFHLQWNPYQGKLLRVIHGKIIDFMLDIRKNSPTLGKIIGHEMNSHNYDTTNEWIWIPPGFAHGFVALEDSTIEYFCTGGYNPECEAGISPFSNDIDWSLCDDEIKNTFDKISSGEILISDKDREAMSVGEWLGSSDSENFIYLT